MLTVLARVAAFFGERFVIAPDQFLVLGEVAFIERLLQRLPDCWRKMSPDVVRVASPLGRLFRLWRHLIVPFFTPRGILSRLRLTRRLILRTRLGVRRPRTGLGQSLLKALLALSPLTGCRAPRPGSPACSSVTPTALRLPLLPLLTMLPLLTLLLLLFSATLLL